MLEVIIKDARFIERCRKFAQTIVVADSRDYVFDNMGMAVAFTTKRPYTREDANGKFVCTPRSTDARDELAKVNTERLLLNFVRNCFDSHVISMSLTTSHSDIWRNAVVIVCDDRVVIGFPDAEGTVQYRHTEPAFRSRRKPIEVTALPNMINRLMRICEASGTPISFELADTILRRAYFQLPPLDDNIEAYGYAIVLLLKNRIMRT